jgi:uncharacterized protein (DUF2267 family)
VEYKELVQAVATCTGFSRQEAADLTRATLEALSDRLSSGEVIHLVLELPEQLKESLRARHRADDFGLKEFVERVSRHTGLTVRETRQGVRAVLTTLRDAISPEEFDHVMSQLGNEYQEIVEEPG